MSSSPAMRAESVSGHTREISLRLIFPRDSGIKLPHISPVWVRTELAASGSSTNNPNDNMRPTMRLHALARRAASGTIPTNRSNNVAFIGLGRMGYEMATNLWRKKFADHSSGELIVCDARQEVAMRFVEETSGKCASFVKTPREYVNHRYMLSDLPDRVRSAF